MKYKKYITLTLSIFLLFCFLGISNEADACKMKDGTKGETVNGKCVRANEDDGCKMNNGKKGETVNGQCVRFSGLPCGNFNVNSGHYGGDKQCTILGLNCPPPTPPPPVCPESTICMDGKDLSIVRSDCSTGSTSCNNLGCKVGTSVCNPPAVDGKCDTAQNMCKTNFGVNLNTPADATGTARWSCLGSNGGKTDNTCSFSCPSGQTVVNNVCVGSCTPVITATQQTKIVNPGNMCSIDWSYNVVPAGGADCKNATTECKLDGVKVVQPYKDKSIDIGTHTLTCTTTVGANSWSATLKPSPQCRLNPYYTEF